MLETIEKHRFAGVRVAVGFASKERRVSFAARPGAARAALLRDGEYERPMAAEGRCPTGPASGELVAIV
jgi:hypothetical protein